MSVSENIYNESLFASVRGTCTHVLHLLLAQISQRDLTQSLFQICSQLPLGGWRPPRRPAPPWWPTSSTLLPSSQPSSPPAALPQTLFRQKLTTMELPQWAYMCQIWQSWEFFKSGKIEEDNLAILCPGKACQGPGQLPQPGTSSGGKILRQPVPAANRCEKEIFCNSCKLRRASGTPCRSWVRRWRAWRSPVPRLWSSHPLNQPSSPLD